MNWTRAHDAWIAQHCEGLEVSTEFGAEPHEIRFDGPWKPVATYNTDTAACIRAAEAWRKKDEDIDRTVTITSPIDRMGIPCTAECSENYREGDGYKWRTFEGQASEKDTDPYAAALAQALYRATGGPA
jgi:hypothetical protein